MAGGQGLVVGVKDLESEVKGQGFGILGLGFMVQDLGLRFRV